MALAVDHRLDAGQVQRHGQRVDGRRRGGQDAQPGQHERRGALPGMPRGEDEARSAAGPGCPSPTSTAAGTRARSARARPPRPRPRPRAAGRGPGFPSTACAASLCRAATASDQGSGPALDDDGRPGSTGRRRAWNAGVAAASTPTMNRTSGPIARWACRRANSRPTGGSSRLPRPHPAPCAAGADDQPEPGDGRDRQPADQGYRSTRRHHGSSRVSLLLDRRRQDLEDQVLLEVLGELVAVAEPDEDQVEARGRRSRRCGCGPGS